MFPRATFSRNPFARPRLAYNAGYGAKVLALAPIAYWKLDDLTGIQATDYSGNGRHGTYSGVTLNASTFVDGTPAPSFDGTNDSVDITSAISSVFSGTAGTVSLWARVSAAGVWTDGVNRRTFRILSGSSVLSINKFTTNNQLRWAYVVNTYQKGSVSTTDWFHVGLTWSGGSTAKSYYAGALESTASPGTWTGAFTDAFIGSANAANFWSGNIAHVALWDVRLSDEQVASLAVVS